MMLEYIISEIIQTEKEIIVEFHLSEIPRTSKFIEK
jgi:hypothetical protein